MQAEVTQRNALDMQVCVPADWSDEQIKDFAGHGWDIRREGDRMLRGDPERNPCTSRQGFVHIMLDA